MSESKKSFSSESINRKEAIWEYHLDNGPFAIIEWDNNFRITRWSQKAELLLGWNSEEVMGMHYSDLNLVPKDELARIKGTTDIILHSNETVVILERNYCHKNGSLLFCRWHNSILRDSNNNLISIFSMVEDISHLKKVQENLRKSEERFELAVAGSKDGIWEWNIERGQALENCIPQLEFL
jgi:PAS domain S-box-containing protein